MIKKILYLNVIILFILAIFNNKIIFTGATTGIHLILFTILPSIFPFLLITGMLSATNVMKYTGSLLYPVLHKVLGLSHAAGYVIVIGFFCGYPVASKVCSDLVQSGELTVNEGNYLLTFINNPSPSFIFSYLAGSILHNSFSSFKLAVSLYIPVILTALIINPFVRRRFKYTGQHSDKHKSDNCLNFEKIMDSSLITMIHISEYVLVFSILCEFTKLIPCRIISIILSGLLEITNGTHAAGISTMPYITRNYAVILFTSLGGLSALLQVKSVIKNSSLSIKWYIIGKLLSSFITLICLQIVFNE